MFVISKDYSFSASHVLEGLPAGHQCARLHGHNYVVRAELTAAAPDARGFVVDYGDLAPFGRWIDDHLDHQHLNDVAPELGNPTAEHLAHLLHDVLRDAVILPLGVGVAIGVSETPKTWAWYRP